MGQRVLAAVVDAASFLVLAALLVPLGLWWLNRGVVFSPVQINVLGVLMLVLPATLWVAIWESVRGATPGKRLLGLRVIMVSSGRRPGFGRSLVRAMIKIAIPWELGHTTALALSAGGDPGAASWVVVALCYLVGLIMIILLLVRPHRPPHDRLAGTRVVPAQPVG